MATLSKWLVVPFSYVALHFGTTALRWRASAMLVEADPSQSSPDDGRTEWLASQSLLEGVAVLVVLLLALPILPRIRWRHAVYVTIAAVAAGWVVGWAWILTIGPSITNGSHVLLTGGTFATVLLLSTLVVRRSA